MSTCLACNDCGEVIYEDFWPEVERGPCPHIERDTLRAENEQLRAALASLLDKMRDSDLPVRWRRQAQGIIYAVLQQEQPATEGEGT